MNVIMDVEKTIASFHKVTESEKFLFIDEKQIHFVLQDSVKTEEDGNKTIVTLSFVAESYEELTDEELSDKFSDILRRERYSFRL